MESSRNAVGARYDAQQAPSSTAPNNPGEARHWSQRLMVLIGILLAVASTLMSQFPSVLSPVEIAVQQALIDRVLDFSGKDGLAYYFTGERRAEVTSVRAHGDTAKASVRVWVPVSPQPIPPGKENSRPELHRYLESKFPMGENAKMPYVVVPGELELVRSGPIGWRVMRDNDLAQRLDQVQAAYDNGSIGQQVMLEARHLPRNIFGIAEFSQSATFMLIQWLMVLAIWVAAMAWGPNGSAKTLVLGVGYAAWNLSEMFLVTMP